MRILQSSLKAKLPVIGVVALLLAVGSAFQSAPEAAPEPTAGTQADSYEATSAPADTPRMLPSAYHSSALIVGTRSLVELVSDASIIVVGQCVEVGAVRNGCFLDAACTQPATDRFCIEQIYRVKAERYIKGEGPEILDYGQGEGFIPWPDSDPSPQTVETAKQSYDGPPPLEPGKRYVLFLRQAPPSMNHLIDAGYPSRFALIDNEAVAQVPGEGRPSGSSPFATQPEASFLYTVEQYVAGNVPTPTPSVTPRPTAVPAEVRLELPSDRVRVGEAFTVALTIDTQVPVRGLDFDLDYDVTALRLEEVREGSFFDSWAADNECTTMVLGQGTRASGGTPIPLGNSSKVAIVLLGRNGHGPSGRGIVFALRFSALTAGVSSIGLKSSAASRILPGEDPEAETILVRVHGVEVTVTDAVR